MSEERETHVKMKENRSPSPIYTMYQTGPVHLNQTGSVCFISPVATQTVLMPKFFFFISTPPDYCLHPPSLHHTILFLFPSCILIFLAFFIFLCTLLFFCIFIRLGCIFTSHLFVDIYFMSRDIECKLGFM